MSTLRAGPMRTRATLQEPYAPASKTTYGDDADSWTDVSTIWCQFLPLGGGEHYSATAEQRVASMTHRVMTRWQPGVGPKMRLKVGETIYNIRSVRNINELNTEMEMYVEEDLL